METHLPAPRPVPPARRPSGHRSLHDQIASRCIHFNGVQNDRCRAGHYYDDVRGSPRGFGAVLPCLRFLAERPATVIGQCDDLRWPTEEEIAAEVAEIEQEGARYLTDVAEGRCPVCHRPNVTPVQVGRCVYGRECGHRMYQGRVTR